MPTVRSKWGAVQSALKIAPTIIEPASGQAKAWIKLIRVHQWAKNALVLIPLVSAHKSDLISIFSALVAFVAFCLAASAVYILNDLIDLESDRKHPTKKRRPLAAGTTPILAALPVAGALLVTSLAVTWFNTPLLTGVLLIYLILTTGYSFFLKRKMLVDVVALASLYTIRVIGGAVAIDVPISEWLLAFSLFIFASLALIKRYVELAGRIDLGLPDSTNRNYMKSDIDIVGALAASAGYSAIIVFALYISSDAVKHSYGHPLVLWLVCPILMYWISRALLMAHRRLLDDDPIVFAIRDWNSLLAAALIGVLFVAAL